MGTTSTPGCEPGCGLNAASWHHQKLYQLNLAIFYAKDPTQPAGCFNYYASNLVTDPGRDVQS